MRIVIQRVAHASVTIGGEPFSSIGRGMMVLVGVEDGRVEAVMDILKENCAKRTETEIVMHHGTGGIPAWRMGGTPVKVEVGGATVFVLEVEEFRKL